MYSFKYKDFSLYPWSTLPLSSGVLEMIILIVGLNFSFSTGLTDE